MEGVDADRGRPKPSPVRRRERRGVMQSGVKMTSRWGKILWLTDGKTEVAAALDFGIRIVHLSCAGMENLFYQQPEDLSDGCCTKEGWRLYGGHRLWLAPEDERAYHPDNDPVRWTRDERGVLLEQEPDPLLGVRKSIQITFAADGGVCLRHVLTNVSDRPLEAASWGINTVDGGGTASVAFAGTSPGDYAPQRVVSLWADTDLHDPQLHFTKDWLTARHLRLEESCKIGLYSRQGKAVLENKGQRLELSFDAAPLSQYPDHGCNFELYLNPFFMELETLGVRRLLQPGQSAAHWEIWHLTQLASCVVQSRKNQSGGIAPNRAAPEVSRILPSTDR